MKLIERKKCPYCESINLKYLYRVNYSANILKQFIVKYYNNKKILDILKFNIYEISECIKCKGLFQRFIPDNNFSYYLYETLISAKKSFNKKKNITQTNYREYLLDSEIIKKLFKKEKNQIKILEFGCGWGFWAKFMQKLNFNVVTIEISDTRANFLKKNQIKNYKNINELDKKYDLIFSNQVLEHIPNPFQTMKDLCNKLNTNGFMYHKFPSSFNFIKKLSKNYKPQKDCAHPLEHINIYTKKSFLIMAKKLKLKVVNPICLKNISIINKLILLKNYLLFNTAILKKIN
jgi:2-polyprenyl-3-methyl-5-hydroxy-6-metoxy-1,4-benzoquinol methylase